MRVAMRALLSGALALLLLVGMVSPGSPRPSAAGAATGPRQSELALQDTVLPVRDLYSLARRLQGIEVERGAAGAAGSFVPSRPAGERATFHVADMVEHTYDQVEARLDLVSEHAYWFTAAGMAVDQAELQAAAARFEERIYPTNRRYFGSEWTPGIDGDPHLFVVMAPLRGAGGYFSSTDEHPRAISPYSNEHETIYIGQGPGDPGFLSTLAHEFQHLIRWNQRPNEDLWLNEGAAELAMDVNGYAQAGTARAFLHAPETQLNAWAEPPTSALPHYGAAFLFLSYLMEHHGGPDLTRALAQGPAVGVRGIDSALAERGYAAGFEGAFRDWVVANLINDRTVADGQYGYAALPERVNPFRILSAPALSTEGQVPQYAAAYVRLPAAATGQRLQFEGALTTRIIDTDACQGEQFWWSNRGDMSDTTLTRVLDLRQVDRATLSFCLWHDIEADFDYGYLEVSRDEGRTWQTLPGMYTTDSNPIGNNFGHGYTGRNDPAGSDWGVETIDLTPYAGSLIQLRFEYVTDDGYNGSGWAVDEIRIPEIGFYDDAETDQGWDAAGFMRIGNVIPQRYVVQLVETGPEGTRVLPVPLDEVNRGAIDLGAEAAERVLVVTPMAPKTTAPAPFHIWVSTTPEPAE